MVADEKRVAYVRYSALFQKFNYVLDIRKTPTI